SIHGGKWPGKSTRNARLKECVDIMRALWAGETVTWNGLVRVEEARVYTRPAQPPPVIGAAITAETARWMGEWVDGLITVSQPLTELEKVVRAFQEGGGAGKPLYLKVQLSFDRHAEMARQGEHGNGKTRIYE